MHAAGVTLATGVEFEGFRIGAPLGHERSGALFRGRQVRGGRPVAIRVPSGVLGAAERRRFLHEAALYRSLVHPHVVRLLHASEVRGQPVLVFEHPGGPTLRERLHRGPLCVAEALRIGTGVASALAFLHHRSVAHGDLRAEHVHLAPGGLVQVGELDLARAGEDGEVAGTASFLAATMFLAAESGRAAEPRQAADLSALGRVLHEMVAGQRMPAGLAQLIGRLRAIEPGQRPTALSVIGLLESLAVPRPPMAGRV